MLETFNLKKTYRYFIYGASIRGKAARKNMEDLGYFVEGFFDKNADNIQTIDGKPVYNPDEVQHRNFENTVVIITITNSYEHPIIADYLHGFGYDKIVYLPFDGTPDLGKEMERFRRFYNNIFNGMVTEDDCFCKYASSLFDTQFQDGAFIREEEDQVLAFLPIELCFSSDHRCNQSSHGAACSKDLLPFSGIKHIPVSIANCDYINYFKAIFGSSARVQKAADELIRCRMSLEPSHREYEKIETDRNALLINQDAIFWSMFRAFQYGGMEYFIDNPIDVIWTSDHVFHVLNGTDKVCFFLALGLNFIPAHMTKADYTQWVNGIKLDACLSYIRENHIAAAYAPIPHPNFRFFPAYRDIGGTTRLQKIGEVLAYNHICVYGKKVLDAGSYYCYLSQYFARLGAQVTAIEYDPISSEFGRRLNDLLYCSGINSVCCGLDVMDISQRYSFTIMLTVLYWYLDDPLGLQILHNIDVVTENFLIWESGDQPEKEIQFILEHSSFKTYCKISETFGTGKVREMGIFCKKRIDISLPECFEAQ